MTKITLTDLVNLQNETTAVNAINANSTVIETAFDNTLSRDGTQPNQMGATLDMNSNHIINLPAPLTSFEPVRLTDLTATPQGKLGTLGLQDSNAVSITGGAISNVSVSNATISGNTTGVTEPVGTNNTTLATTAFVLANQTPGATPASAVPLIDTGTGAVGTSLLYARQDHVHPISTASNIPISGSRISFQNTDFTGFNQVQLKQSYALTVPGEPSTTATYIRISGTPSPTGTGIRGYIQDVTGAWFQNNESQLWASQFRVSGDGNNWQPAIQGMLDFAAVGQVCNVETTTAALYIKPSTYTDHLFQITKQLILRGGNLYWDSALGSADIFWINPNPGSVIQYLKIRDMTIKPSTNFGILPTDLWVAHLNGLVYGSNIFTIKDSSFTQFMEISGCVFGPVNGFGLNIAVSQPDFFRGCTLFGNNFWNGHLGMIGDSCSFRNETMNGFQTAFELFQGPGSSVCEIDHCNIFNNNGALLWLGGDRLRYTNNNAEQFGPKTGPITAIIDIANSSNSSNLNHIFEGNHTGALIATSGTFAGQPTALSRIFHAFNMTNGKLDCNDFISTDPSCSSAVILDPSCSAVNLRPTNNYGGLSVFNSGTGTIST